MDDDDEKLRLTLLQEFAGTRDRWTDQRLRLAERSNELQTGVSERNFNIVLALVSVTAGFLAVAAPIAQASLGGWLFIPIIASFITTATGITHLLLVTWWDRRCIAEDSTFYMGIYGKFQGGASEIYADLYLDEAIPREKIENYYKLPETTKREIDDWKNERDRSAYARLINFSFYLFFIAFGISFILLLCVLAFNIFAGQGISDTEPLWNHAFRGWPYSRW